MGIAESTIKKKNENIKKANITVKFEDLSHDVYNNEKFHFNKHEYWYTIEIDQLIEPQMRPRGGKFGNVYDPLKTYKKIIREKIKKEIENNNIPLYIDEDKYYIMSYINLYKTPPKNWSINKQLNAILGLYPFTKKPDIDNCVKTIYDSLEGIFFFNDGQINHENLIKMYSPKDKTIIRLNVIEKEPLVKYNITKKNINENKNNLDEEVIQFLKERMK